MIVGCGGVASGAIHKCCQNSDAFEEILIASRTKSKCDALKAKLDGGKTKIRTAQVDADRVEELIALIKDFRPDVVQPRARIGPDHHGRSSRKNELRGFANYERGGPRSSNTAGCGVRENFQVAGICANLGRASIRRDGVFCATRKSTSSRDRYIDISRNGGDPAIPRHELQSGAHIAKCVGQGKLLGGRALGRDGAMEFSEYTL
jgi:saccharopine dehydrogenase (NAD+, L-lysine-forming)